ncbi:MAG: hypothetical protein U5L45_12900 [Saprospiraceae bacterium]|nr:hypothetical protein [Saprospiraceae bacterium]
MVHFSELCQKNRTTSPPFTSESDVQGLMPPLNLSNSHYSL